MKSLFSTVLFFVLVTSCDSSKKISSSASADHLKGTWQLNYITGPRLAFDRLYPEGKPTINFDITDNRVSGNNSCNSFSGFYSTDGSKIHFRETLASTKTACGGEGESVFMRTLATINTYHLTQGYILSLFTDSVASMRFTRVR